jgi:hypothetical protein
MHFFSSFIRKRQHFSIMIILNPSVKLGNRKNKKKIAFSTAYKDVNSRKAQSRG